LPSADILALRLQGTPFLPHDTPYYVVGSMGYVSKKTLTTMFHVRV
jgi:hypothetical protein